MVAYSFKRRFVDPIRVGLSSVSLSFDCPPKRQTIRAIGRKRHARAGETLQLYTAMRTKQCASIGVARCTTVDNIRIAVEAGCIVTAPRTDHAQVIKSPAYLDAFAVNDGFTDWADMRQFWRDEHGDLARLGPFVGILIQWEPIR
jgi:hypothetical protein